MEKYTVSLDEFIRYLMKKWFVILISVILGIGAFIMSASVLGQNIVIPQSDKYAGLKEEEAAFEKYIEEAPLMKMDSTNIHERIIYLSNIADKEILKNYVDAGIAWENWNDENFKTYFSDHITWKDGEKETAEIEIWYYDDMECEKMMKHLADQIKKIDGKAEVLLGDPHVINDELTSDTQHWYINRLNDIQGQLEHTASGYTIEVNILMAAVIGIMTGMCISVGYLFVAFLCGQKRKM